MIQTPDSDSPAGKSNPKSKRGGARAGAGRKPAAARLATEIRNALGAFPSADRFSPQRTYVYYPLLTADKEHDAGTRLEIARKARALYNASGTAVRAIDGPARAAVGVGMVPAPCTSSDLFNDRISSSFANGPEIDARFFDAARQVNYHEALDVLLRQALIDGDVFWQKLRATDGTSRVRFVEGVHVGNTPRHAPGFEQSRWTDGAMLDPLGAPMKWRVLREPLSDEFTDVDATDLMQVKRKRRANGIRGVSSLAVAANHIHDMTDIVSMVKHGYKIASNFPFVFYSERGPGVLGAVENSTDTTTGVETRTLQQRAEAGVLTLRSGEKVENLPNQLPGETFTPFMAELRREIAESVGAPHNVLFDISEIGGANNRWVLVEYQFLLDEIQWMLISQFCRPWYLDWLWHEIEAGYLGEPDEIPDDWWKVIFTTPAKPTVDNGRDGKLMLEQIKEGFLPGDYVHALFGRSGRDMDAMQVETALRRRRLLADTNEKLAQQGQPPLTEREVFGSQEQAAQPPDDENDDASKKQPEKE